jgi:hypothetical protein
LRNIGRCQGFSDRRCAHGHMVVIVGTRSELWGLTHSERGRTRLDYVFVACTAGICYSPAVVFGAREPGDRRERAGCVLSCPHPLPADTAAHRPPPGGPLQTVLVPSNKTWPKKETRAVVFECFRFHTNCPRSWIRGPPSRPLLPVGTPSPKSNIANISIATASAGAATHARRPESNE